MILIQPLLHVGVRGHRDLRAPGDRVPAELEDMATDLSRANTDAMERI